MNDFMSRAENIRRREMEAAKRGQWSLKTKLYKSEIKKFSKQQLMGGMSDEKRSV